MLLERSVTVVREKSHLYWNFTSEEYYVNGTQSRTASVLVFLGNERITTLKVLLDDRLVELRDSFF